MSSGILLALSLACSRKIERFTAPTYTGPFKPAVDFSPIWSHDGRYIAYHRAYPSRDGPAGIYVVPASGGHPRFISPGSFLWPSSLRFSPDDHALVGIDGRQLVIIDLSSGISNNPTYTGNEAAYPDWSPDGGQIIYNRVFLTSAPPQPYDSAGIHIYNTSTGQDHPIFNGGNVVFGLSPRWSPDGSRIAFLRPTTPQTIMLMRGDGSDLRLVLQAPLGTDLRGLTWFRQPDTGAEGLIYMESNGHTFFVNPADGIPTRLQLLYGYESFSPDGYEYTLIGSEASDSLGVVFAQRVSDFTGETLRQITSFAPP